MLKTIISAAALIALAAPAHAESWDFVLVNKTGKAVKTVEVSDSGKADWKKEALDEGRVTGEIKPGDNHTVHFEKDAKACTVDVRMTFADDSQAVWTGFNVCNYAFGDFSLKGDLPVVKGT